MSSYLSHLQVNVSAPNIGWYSDLFDHLGWKQLMRNERVCARASGLTSLWFQAAANGHENDRDGVGTNHIGLGVGSRAEIDALAEFLRGRGIELMFDTPRDRPEMGGPNNSYYQVMFESPDGVLFEAVHVGKGEGKGRSPA